MLYLKNYLLLIIKALPFQMTADNRAFDYVGLG